MKVDGYTHQWWKSFVRNYPTKEVPEEKKANCLLISLILRAHGKSVFLSTFELPDSSDRSTYECKVHQYKYSITTIFEDNSPLFTYLRIIDNENLGFLIQIGSYWNRSVISSSLFGTAQVAQPHAECTVTPREVLWLPSATSLTQLTSCSSSWIISDNVTLFDLDKSSSTASLCRTGSAWGEH